MEGDSYLLTMMIL